jgi:hypothetical protein
MLWLLVNIPSFRMLFLGVVEYLTQVEANTKYS